MPGQFQRLPRWPDYLVLPGPPNVGPVADSDKKGPMMLQHGTGTRELGRVGLCSAFLSSILVLAGSTSAAAHEIGPMYQDQNGHFTVQLTPGEVPEGGDQNGQGTAELNLSEAGKQACFSTNWKGLKGQVTAFHLHAASQGNEGPPFIHFFDNQNFPGADGKASGCVPATADQIHAVIANPAKYYLNLHSTAFTDGALRGQLQ